MCEGTAAVHGARENVGAVRIAVFARFVVETVARPDFGHARAWMTEATGHPAFPPLSRGPNPMFAPENTTNMF